MSRVRILSNPVLPYVKSISSSAILVSPWAGTHVSNESYSSVTAQIRAQFLSDSEGLYIPIRNR